MKARAGVAVNADFLNPRLLLQPKAWISTSEREGDTFARKSLKAREALCNSIAVMFFDT